MDFMAGTPSPLEVPLTWTIPASVQPPDGFLIIAALSGNSITPPMDGVFISNEFDFTDGFGAFNVGDVNLTSFPNLLSGTDFDFQIFPYTNSGNEVDYKINATIPETSATTSTAISGRLFDGPTNPRFSSIVNAEDPGIINFLFALQDDTDVNPVDNANLLVNRMVFTRGPNNEVDWLDAIAGAVLRDQRANPNGSEDHGTAIITADEIIIPNISTSVDSLGHILDNEFSIYELQIWLKEDLGGDLPETIDGLTFEFLLDAGDIMLDPGSSQLINDVITSGPGANAVEVVATTLQFTQEPPEYSGIGAVLDPVPEVRAFDKNGNLDRNYNELATVVTDGGLPLSNAPNGFFNGILSFAVAPPFSYSNSGDGTLEVFAPGVTSARSLPVDVIDTRITKLKDGVAGEEFDVDRELRAGSLDKVILGVGLNSVTGNPGLEPSLSSLTFDFSNDIDGAFENIRLYRSEDPAIDILEILNNTPFATVPDPAGPQTTVLFDNLDVLLDGNTDNQHFFLVVDVGVTVGITSDPIQPRLPTSGISVTEGSVSGFDIAGFDYTFNDVTPPQVVAITPANGSRNVALGTDFVITFNEPVISLDNEITLVFDDITQVIAGTATLVDVSPDQTALTFEFAGNLESDTRYFVGIQQGNSIQGTGITDNSGNPFPGFLDNSSWAFETSDEDPPVFVVDPEVVNIIDESFDLRAALDEEGRVYYLIVDDMDPAPTTVQVRDQTAYEAAHGMANVVASGVIDNFQKSTFFYQSVDGLSPSTDYDVYFTAEDLAQPNPNQITDDPIKVDAQTTAPSPAGVTIQKTDLMICVGSFQRILAPIHITEGVDDDFAIGPDQTFNLTLPQGFVFNTEGTGGAIATPGRNISDIQFRYLNSTTIQLEYDVDATDERDRITIGGLEVQALGPVEDAFMGDLIRIGGSADQNGNNEGDGLSHGNFMTVGSAAPEFTSDPSFTSPIGNDIESVLLIPTEDLETFQFSGPGVFGSTLFTEIAGIGDHEVTLTKSDDFGCVSSTTNTIRIIDAETAIADLDATYCIDENPDIILANDVAGNRFLLNLTFERVGEPGVEPEGLDTLNRVNYVFDPSLPGPGSYIFTAEYRNSEGRSETFIQNVTLFTPPEITGFKIDSIARPVFINSQFCRDDLFIDVTVNIDFKDGNGILTPEDGFFTVRKTDDITNTLYLAEDNVGLFDNGDGTAFIDTETITDLLGFGSYHIGFDFVDNNFCSDFDEIEFFINPQPETNFMVSDGGPGGDLMDPAYCSDGPNVNLQALDGLVPVGSGIFVGSGIVDKGDGTADFNPGIAFNLDNSTLDHEISLIYTDSTTGCSNLYLRDLRVNPLPNVDLTIPPGSGPDNNGFCVDGGVIPLNGTPMVGAGQAGFFSLLELADGNGIDDTGEGTATFNQAIAFENLGGNDDLKEVTLRYNFINQNGCMGVDEEKVTIKAPPTAGFNVLVDGIQTDLLEFCVNTSSLIRLEGDSLSTLNASLIFSGPGILPLPSGDADFDPRIAHEAFLNTQGLSSDELAQSSNSVSLRVIDLFGCENTSSEELKVNPTPHPDFELMADKQCDGEALQFSDRSQTVAGDNPATFFWNFDVLEVSTISIKDTMTTNSNLVISYAEPQEYVISLAVETEKGCLSTTSKQDTLLVGRIPEPTLSWENICEQNGTVFRGSPVGSIGFGSVEQFIWDFNDPNGVSSPPNPEGDSVTTHQFSAPGNYEVTLTMITNTGCDNVASREVFILPKISVDATDEYLEAFGGDQHGWQTEIDSTIAANSSWDLGLLNGAAINEPGNRAWATNPSGSYNANEISYVYSPCFDISGLERPMVAFDRWVDINNADGVVLQYAIDGGKNWEVLRVETDQVAESGLNWYNVDRIAANPGGQDVAEYGWSGQESGSMNARHKLDIKEIPIDERNELRLRFAFSSIDRGSVEEEGFAFDNFFIGERRRLVILEQFTNASDTQSKTANEMIDPILDQLSRDVIKIAYHTDFPGNDPFNLDNALDPSGRRAYYNIGRAPYSVLDGIEVNAPSLNNDQLTWGISEINRRALMDPQFGFTLDPTDGESDEVVVRGQISSVSDFEGDEIRLYLAVVERLVTANAANGETDFRNVLRKMLPDAGGILLGSEVGARQDLEVDERWPIRNAVDPDQLALVVFVQNNETREILQGALYSLDGKAMVTGIGDMELKQLIDEINLYPNPTSQLLNITLAEQLTRSLDWRVIDSNGVQVSTGTIPAGLSGFQLETNTLPSGLYYLLMDDPGTEPVPLKFMVVH